jgi:L-ascorbate metabolism protein UlaG (beta-lactamase superfamily)
MPIQPTESVDKSTRERLPNRRGNVSFNFLHDGRTYHATATHYQDGRLAEIFLDVGRAGSTVQQHAEATAVLASLALQSGVEVQTIVHAVSGGPLAAALLLASAP